VRFEEFEKEIMDSIELDIVKNKELYEKDITDMKQYSLDLMDSQRVGNVAFNIQSDDSFEEICKEIEEMKKSLLTHKVSGISEASIEKEGDEWAGFYYWTNAYTPIESFSELVEWEQKYIIQDRVALKLELPNKNYLRCEVMDLYKQDIITLEQLKQAHKKGC